MTPAPKNLREALERVRSIAVGRLANRREWIDDLIAKIDADDAGEVVAVHADEHGPGCCWFARGRLTQTRVGRQDICSVAVYGDLCGEGIHAVNGPHLETVAVFDPRAFS
jgi:hypothetical protein